MILMWVCLTLHMAVAVMHVIVHMCNKLQSQHYQYTCACTEPIERSAIMTGRVNAAVVQKHHLHEVLMWTG